MARAANYNTSNEPEGAYMHFWKYNIRNMRARCQRLAQGITHKLSRLVLKRLEKPRIARFALLLRGRWVQLTSVAE
jgi:hypothetical protein